MKAFLAIVATIFAFGTVQHAQAAVDRQLLFSLDTDACNFDKDGTDTQLHCDFYVTKSGATATGLYETCNDGSPDQSFTLTEVLAGVTIKKSDDGNHRVVFLKGNPGLDGTHGGTATMTYLRRGHMDASSDEYSNYSLEVQNTGAKWIVLTGADQGHRAFTSMWMKGHVSDIPFVGVDGIDAISVH